MRSTRSCWTVWLIRPGLPGLQLAGEGGLLAQLTKRVLESALEGELTDHLGYDKHDPAGKNAGNSRNGSRSKTVLTEVGPVEFDVPRDRDGSFEPKIVAKRQRRLSGADDLVISLSARGLTAGEVQARLADVHGAEVSRQTISTITYTVMDGMAEWAVPLRRASALVGHRQGAQAGLHRPDRGRRARAFRRLRRDPGRPLSGDREAAGERPG